jgi:hypothetical protein
MCFHAGSYHSAIIVHRPDSIARAEQRAVV